jgi:calcium-dependent protein kinase
VQYINRYCEGSDLSSKVKKLKCLTEGKTAKVIRQILSAMVLCHSKNIIHRYYTNLFFRDLKPENILFESQSIDSTVKVIDFGRSKILKPHQKLTEIAGSVNYFISIFSFITWLQKFS